MRSAGLPLALLFGVSVVAAQPPAQPMPPPPPAAPKADPQLDGHLAAWEKKMVDVKNLRTEVALKRTDGPPFKKEREYTGVVLCMKPTFARLRLEYTPDTKDYEAYICDGKALFMYNGKEKTITEFKLPQGQQGVDNLMLDFLAGMKAKDVKARFDITLFKTDDYYVYFDVKPLRPADQREFKHMRMALYGPNTKFAYLPAQVFLLKPDDSSELWKFTKPEIDLAGVDEKLFQFVPVQGFERRVAPQPGAPAPPPGGGAPLPPGGLVRPNQK